MTPQAYPDKSLKKISTKGKKLSLFLIFAILLMTTFVSAAVTEDNKVFYAIIKGDNSIDYTNTPLTGVQFAGFICNDVGCTSQNGELWDGRIITTGSDNQVDLVYPDELASVNGYGVYIFKSGYLPWYFPVNYAGSGTASPVEEYLYRKQGCSSDINSVNIEGSSFNSGDDVVVKVNVQSPFVSPNHYVPVDIRSYFYTTVRVNLKITNTNGAVVYQISEDVKIYFGSSKTVSFTWPTTLDDSGDYSVRVSTSVPDAQCLSSNPDFDGSNSVTVGNIVPDPDSCIGGTNQCFNSTHIQGCITGSWGTPTLCPSSKPLCSAGECIAVAEDKDGDGYNSDVDCNDNNYWINPGAREICWDGIDNNCNGLQNEGCSIICTSFVYSSWSVCSNGVQTRTVVSRGPIGCIGGNPILTQSCSAINNDPTLNIPDQTINEGDLLNLNLNSYSNDADGDVLTYTIFSGVGTVAGNFYSYTSLQDANINNEIFTVTIQVNDGNGGVVQDTFTITVIDDDGVINNDPVVNSFVANPITGNAPLTVSFSGSVSDVDGNALTCTINFGDGSVDEVITSCTSFSNIGHIYTNVGNYVATLTVNDGNGGIVTDTENIQANNPSGSLIWFTNPTTSEGYYSQTNIEASVEAIPTNLVEVTIYLYDSVGSLVGNVVSGNNVVYEDFTGLNEGEYDLSAIAEYSGANIENTEIRRIVLDLTDPIITLIDPDNDDELDDSDVEFEYEVDDNYGIDRCELYIDNSLARIDNSVSTSSVNEFEVDLSDGDYDWRIECYDLAGNLDVSLTRSIEVEDDDDDSSSSTGSTFIDARNFDGFSLIDLNGTINLEGRSGRMYTISMWVPLFLLLAIILLLILIYLLNRDDEEETKESSWKKED